MLCEDEDIMDENITGGKLLILAEDFSNYKNRGKAAMLKSSFPDN